MTKDLAGQWAVVTGASSGLGIDFAHLLAERGAHLVLVARRAPELETLAAELQQKFGVRTHVVPMNLARPGVGQELKANLDAAGITVDVLVNNAGYGLHGDFLEQPLERTLDMLQLDVLSLTELTHVFGNDMARRGRGHILLIASIGAFQATPTYAAYGASKAYVLMFGEALHEELQARGVTVTTLSPGVTRTSFFAVAGQKPNAIQRLTMMESRPVAQLGLAALQAGRASLVAGFMNALTVFLVRFTPRWLQPRLARAAMKDD